MRVKKEMKEHIKIIDAMMESLKFSTVDQKPILPTLKVAKEAIQRRTPTKPYYEGDGYDDKGELIYDTWICPNCGERFEVDYDDYKYCPECGQKLDWGEVK